MIPVYKPYLNSHVIRKATDALESTWISSKGHYINNVESRLSSMYYVDDARINTSCVTNNGTSAMHLTARLLDKEKPKINKIIVPNNSYVAAWNAFLFDHKYEILPVEADISTWNYDLEKLYEVLNKSNFETTALLIVHNIGNIINVPQILRDWKDLTIIEDNCEGFLGEYEGKPSGSISFASAISFFGNKNITSGEGGAVIAQSKYQGYLYKLRSQGQSDNRFIHDELGYNYRMTNIQAALLDGQLDYLDEIKKLKSNVFDLYRNLLADISEASYQVSDRNTKHSNWMFGIRVLGNVNYNEMEKFFHDNYIDVRPMFYPINKHSYLNNIKCYGGFSIAEQLNRECVILPSYPDITDHEICHVVNTLKQYLVKK